MASISLFVLYNCIGIIASIIYGILFVVMLGALPSTTIHNSILYTIVAYIVDFYIGNIIIIPFLISELIILFLIKELIVDIKISKMINQKN